MKIFRFWLLFVMILYAIGMAAEPLRGLAATQRPTLPYFPDILGYKTLVCDLHEHTVFSDGRVWPTVRMEEAWREGLDAIALTEHIEDQKFKKDIPTNRERSFEIALPLAQQMNVLLIKGTEISKSTPPGHYNAIFVTAIDPINEPNVLDAVRIAATQKAFVWWNHPQWQGKARGQWTDIQTEMLKYNWLQGIEVANRHRYFPLSFQYALDKNLTMLGGSDIHNPSSYYIYTPQEHRTVTLVLARERSVEAIHEALLAGRTIVWNDNTLIGREIYLRPLYEASVSVSKAYYTEDNTLFFEISNRALIDLEFVNTGTIGPESLTVPAHSTVRVKTETAKDSEPQVLMYVIQNLLIAPQNGLPVKIKVTADVRR